MKKKILKVTPILALFISLNTQAQKNFAPAYPRVLQLEKSAKSESFSFPEIENFDGTYQFIVKQKADFVLTTETFQLIDKSRKQSEDFTLYLSDGLDVFIPSKEAISSKNFVPFSKTHTLK